MEGFKFFLLILITSSVGINSLELKSGAYEDLVITISDEVPANRCKDILLNLETVLSSASNYLFSALHGRAFIRSSTVILPTSWPNSCSPNKVVAASGEESDITILPGDASKGKMWTQQSGGCGKSGDQIYFGYKSLENKDSSLGHLLVKEFAMYRYGVFEEKGYRNNPIHPLCYYDKNSEVKVTGCSDFPINDDGICSGNENYNISNMVDSKARTSIMFAPEVPSVSMFCDDGNHDSYAPTKHNLLCNRRNTFDVILQHSDFHSYSVDNSKTIANTSSKITYKKHYSTRYVFVIENTKNMAVRESWNFLRSAIRKWVNFDLPDNSEVGLVLTNDSDAVIATPIKRFKSEDKYMIDSALPYYTSETSQSPCLHCAITKGLDMFNEMPSPATKVMIIISAGVNNNSQLNDVVKKVKENKIKIASITYPNQIRQRSLDFLAELTNGVAYTVNEQKQNVVHSMISTYFELSNVLYNIIERYYAGNKNEIAFEIHRREIKSDRSSITGSFYVDENVSAPIKFMLYTHNPSPLIRSMELVSPSQQIFRQRADLLDVKIISIRPNMTETGTWTYSIEPVTGNPQPHFLQVTTTPRNRSSEIIRSKFWVSKSNLTPPILYVEVKMGNNPIISAKVEVKITKYEENGSILHQEVLQLFDTGSGDPDINKNDGIYSRYHNPYVSGAGNYEYQVVVNDNGNTAYIYQAIPYGFESVNPKRAITMAPFERFLTPITLEITQAEINFGNENQLGKILDLKVDVKEEKAILSWTSPDMGGHEVSFYDIKFAENIQDITDNFEMKTRNWEGTPHALSTGSDTSFSLDFSQRKDLLDKPLYFAIKSTSKVSSITTISNYIRIYIKSPPPPSTISPTFPTNDHSLTPIDDYNMSVHPNLMKETGFGNEIIFAVIGVVILLIIILTIYYCFCIKRKNRIIKSKSDSLKADKLTTTITIVPNTPQQNQNCYSNHQISDNDHTIGVPVNYPFEDEPKKRYSLVQQQEQQLIEELKQQHLQNPQNYSGLSVISNGSLQRNHDSQNVNSQNQNYIQPTLSPFNSWSASQLLHEHERRHSPADEQMLTQHQEIMNQLDHMSLNGQNVDHVSLSSHHQMGNLDHYNNGVSGHVPPPVPPLPVFNGGYPPVKYIYGVHPASNQIYQSMPRNTDNYSTSLQGSMNSVNSGEKKRRNVTMV
nr:calcium-activated chloride channel regulator 4-like [Onthophagus taurus]